MNNQEAFDIMVKHLRKQGRRCMADKKCLYRGPDGMKCAVGALIPDSHYDPEMESGGAAEDIAGNYRIPEWDGIETALLSNMQDVHDSFDPSDWERKFAAVAADFGLTVPPMEAEQ